MTGAGLRIPVVGAGIGVWAPPERSGSAGSPLTLSSGNLTGRTPGRASTSRATRPGRCVLWAVHCERGDQNRMLGS
jgi:hypothetical protein